MITSFDARADLHLKKNQSNAVIMSQLSKNKCNNRNKQKKLEMLGLDTLFDQITLTTLFNKLDVIIT